jgi:hypothetical protein
MFPCGKKNLQRGQVFTFYPKDSTGSGECRFPAHFEIFTLKAVRSLLGRNLWRIARKTCISAHTSI